MLKARRRLGRVRHNRRVCLCVWPSADKALADLRTMLVPDLPGPARMIEAARLKAQHSIALGDCFALATAAAHGATLLTGDPEIIELPDPPCEVEDLRLTV